MNLLSGAALRSRGYVFHMYGFDSVSSKLGTWYASGGFNAAFATLAATATAAANIKLGGSDAETSVAVAVTATEDAACGSCFSLMTF